MTTGKPSFIVVDYETTGLDPSTGLPLEFAALVVDDDLNVIAEQESLIVPAAQILWDDLAEVAPKVVEMHTKNGLIEAIDAAMSDEDAPGLATVEEDFIGFLVEHHAEDLPMCGSSVQFDRSWMRVHMPELERHFHYRNIDISTVKELCRRYNPPIFAQVPQKLEHHRSLLDVHETLAELRFYLDNFLWTA